MGVEQELDLDLGLDVAQVEEHEPQPDPDSEPELEQGLGLGFGFGLGLGLGPGAESESDIDIYSDPEPEQESVPETQSESDPEPQPQPHLGSHIVINLQPDPEFDDIPSLDDIIPWTAQERKPRQPLVFDTVHTAQGINSTFVENAMKSYFMKDDETRVVTVGNQVENPMSTLNISQRNILREVNVECTVDDIRETYHLVIKTLTALQPVRALSAVHSFDRREVGFYTQILDDLTIFQQQEEANPALHLKIPSCRCFFARYTPPAGEIDGDDDYNIPPDESVLVLENVKYQGFTHTIVDIGLSEEQVLTVFEGMARLHGLSLAMKERSGIPLQRSYPYLICLSEVNECVVKLFDKHMPEVQQTLTILGAGDLGLKVMALRPRLRELVAALSRPEEPVSVLSHMNLWAHNILFKGDNECVLVDWQMISCTRPTFDLAFLLATSVNSSLRRVHTEEFLTTYYERFTTYALRYGLDVRGDLGYTSEHLRQDFAYSQLLSLFFWIAKSRDLMKSRETELQFIDYLHDLDGRSLLNPDVIDIDNIEYVYWMPPNPRSNMVFRIERRRSSSDDPDHFCGLFPVRELPED